MLDAEDWKVELRGGLNEIMESAVRAGARADQVFDALADTLQAMKEDWGRGVDRATNTGGEPLEEPANNWPAAEN